MIGKDNLAGRNSGAIGLFTGCTGLILVGWSLYSGGESLMFAALGHSAPGIVTNSQSSGHQSRSYTDYTFRAEGVSYLGTAQGLELAPGRKVTVVYLPSNPGINRLDRQHWLPMGLIALIVGVLALAIAVRCFKSNDNMYE